jgi:putative sterol carrier protein
VVRPMAERAQAEAGPQAELLALKALTLDADRLRLLKEASGVLRIKATTPEREYALTITVGAASGEPGCEIACTLEDLWALQSGKTNPIELLMAGKIRITGDAQLALSLSAALA